MMQAGRWASLPAEITGPIKSVTLEALVSEDERVAGAAAQLIAAIADIDLPRNEWSELMSVLVENTQAQIPTHVKKASLLAIGYICETADPSNSGVVAQASGILTAIIQGARPEEPSVAVRLTAINALVNSLEFVKMNFANEPERNFIMQVVCEATQAEDLELQAAAFGAMARIMSLYYHYMKIYMQSALFNLTVNGMKSSSETVACMAVEFWSTVCEEEIQITQNQELDDSEEVNYDFATSAIAEVLPTLLTLLTKQEEDSDDDEWSVAMAAGACLQLYAQNTGSVVVAPVLQFVEQNIGSSSWKQREAAVMAFGSILEGPDPVNLKDPITQALPPLLELMADSSLQVRDTVAWCLGRMALVNGIDLKSHLERIIEALCRGLVDSPKVALNCCWTIMNLTEQLNHDSVQEETSPMSPFYGPLIPLLLELASKGENENSCRSSAFEALSSLAIFSSLDVLETVRSLSGDVLQRLDTTLMMQQQGVVSIEDKSNLEELQSNLLGLLTNIIRRVGEDVLPAANRLMELFLNLLQNKFANSLIEEDVFIAIGSVASTIDDKFEVYMEALVPFILSALKDPESQICITAIGLISDISHALGPKIDKYSETFMKVLGETLQRPETPRDVQAIILSCFGDIASSMGPSFSFFLDVVMQVIGEASTVQTDPDSSLEFLDYVTRLREAITDAYVGIVTGLRDSPNEMLPYVKPIISFLSVIRIDSSMIRSDSTVRSIVGLLGDIASMYAPGQLRELYQEDWITELIRSARTESAYSEATNETARWAREQQKLQLAQ